MFTRIALSLAALAVAGPALFAQTPKEAAAPTLKVGMPAPALTIEKWVKGAPVANFEKGKTYVVEFWATWCGPCVASMPHLSAMQREYKDKNVTFIGVTSVDKSNTLEKVEKMVADKGDGMGYTVAWDTSRKTNEAYMQAAGQGGIPCSFLIDKTGNIAYIGHPMFLDEPLAEVVAGKWDIAKGNARIAEAEKAMDAVYEAAQGDPKVALAKIADFEKQYPKMAAHFESMKFSMLLTTGDFDSAYKVGGALVDKAIAAKNAGDLNQVAWSIVDPEAKIEKRDVELALRAALKADEFTGSKDAATIDTLARCYATKGDLKKAVELQTKAVELADARMKPSLQKALDEYKTKNTQ